MPEIITIKSVSYSQEIQTIRQIRSSVFQQEQNVPEEIEFDGLDNTTEHLLAYLNNEPVGTLRIREIDLNTAKIQRVSVLLEARNKGIGRKLMETAIAIIQDKNQYERIVIDSQYRLEKFYHSFGFRSVGEPFEDANILHIQMIKSLI